MSLYIRRNVGWPLTPFFELSIQSVGGLQIVDTLSSRTYELDNLAQVFVYSSELSPFSISTRVDQSNVICDVEPIT